MPRDQDKRRKAASLLEDLTQENKTMDEVAQEWPGNSEDMMLDAILRRVREHHTLSDAFEGEDEGQTAASESEDLLERCIEFLKSNESYEWPPMPGQHHVVSTLRAVAIFVVVGWAVIFMGMFMSIAFIIGGILLLISYLLQRRHERQFDEAGDLGHWPFVDEQQRARCSRNPDSVM